MPVSSRSCRQVSGGTPVRHQPNHRRCPAAGPSGPCLMGDLPLLEDPDGVAEGVADAHVGAVEVVGGLLGEVGNAARLEVSYRPRMSSALNTSPPSAPFVISSRSCAAVASSCTGGPGSSREISVTSPGTRTVSQR